MNNEARILREGIERALTQLGRIDIEHLTSADPIPARIIAVMDKLETVLARADKEGKR